MFAKNWTCVVALAVLALLLTAVPAQAADIIIVSDDFTGDGTMTNRTPDGINLPGNNWTTQANYHGVPSTSGGQINNTPHGALSVMDIASSGGYTKPTQLTVSITVRPDAGEGLRRGVGAMFSYAAPSPNDNGQWGQYLGLTLTDEGRVDYYTTLYTGDFNTRSPSSVQDWNTGEDGTFDPTALHTLIYTVDTVSGELTDVSLSDSTQSFAAILADAATPFTDANTRYVGISADDNNGGATPADISSIEISTIPEPSMLALLATGLLGLLAYAWRKRK